MKKLSASDKWAIAVVAVLLILTALNNAYLMVAVYSAALIVGVIIAYKKGQLKSVVSVIVFAAIIASVVAIITLAHLS